MKNGATDRTGCGCPRVTIGFFFAASACFLRDVAVLGHLLQRVIAAELGGSAIDVRALASRRLDDAGNHRGFFERDVLRALAEIQARGGFDAVRAMAEVRLVAVERQDLALGVALLDLNRDENLFDLPLRALVAADEANLFGKQVARELHRQRAGTGDDAPPDDVAARGE